MPFDPTSLLDNGIAVFVIGWFMFRNEKKLSGLSRAIVLQAKVMMLIVEKFGDRKVREGEHQKLKDEIDSVIHANGS